MTGPARTRGSALRRVLAVLVLCSGIVLMHQMGGPGHRMVEPDVLGAPAVAGAPAGPAFGATGRVAVVDTGTAAASAVPMPDAMTGDPRDAVTRVSHASVAVSAPHLLSAGATCVAVLMALLLLAARRWADADTMPSGAGRVRPGHGTSPLGRGPPRALLAQICVLRT